MFFPMAMEVIVMDHRWEVTAWNYRGKKVCAVHFCRVPSCAQVVELNNGNASIATGDSR